MKTGSTSRHEGPSSETRLVASARVSEPPQEEDRGPWTDESWIDSLTREALQNVNRAIVAVSDITDDLESGGSEVNAKDVKRVAVALRVVRRNLRCARQSHLRPLLERSGDRKRGAR